MGFQRPRRAWLLCTWECQERSLKVSVLQPPQYFTNRLDESQNMSSVTAELSKDTQPSATPTALSPERTSLSAIFNNVMTLCAMLPLLFFTYLNSFLHRR